MSIQSATSARTAPEKRKREEAEFNARPCKVARTESVALDSLAGSSEILQRVERLEGLNEKLMARIEAMEEKIAVMYRHYLEEQSTDELTPSIECEPQESAVLNDLFCKLYFPLNECKLLESEETCAKKLADYQRKIAIQQREQKPNRRFDAALEALVALRKLKDTDPSVAAVEKYAAGVAAEMGPKKAEMQDAFVSFSFDVRTPDGVKPAYFNIVFDGHGGQQASFFCRDKVQEVLALCMEKLNCDGADQGITNALKIAFVRLDCMIKKHFERPEINLRLPGTTACLTMVVGDALFVAGCGDSRAVLNPGETGASRQLSFDYKASDAEAQKTTLKRNGTLRFNCNALRVEGSLMVTRALGDWYLMKPEGKVISPRPGVLKLSLREVVRDVSKSCIILASDGMFDVCSSKQAGDWGLKLMTQGFSRYEIAHLMLAAAREAGSGDDITVAIVPLYQT